MRDRIAMRLVAGVLLGLFTALFAAGARGEDAALPSPGDSPPARDGKDAWKASTPREPSSGNWDLSGFFNQSYQYRSSGDETDQDVYGFLSLDGSYSRSEVPGGAVYRKLGLHLEANYDLDIDSFRSSRETSRSSYFPFFDASDTFSERFHAFLQSAYVEAEDLAFLERVRFGRQRVFREEGFLFDGGYARTKRWKTLSLEMYGGLPAHLYESSASNDALAGVALETRPTPGLTLGGDYVFVRDAREGFPEAEDHLWILRGHYLIDPEWSVEASASWVADRDRRQLVALRYQSESWGLLGHLRAIRQNGIVDFHSDELSPFQLVQGRYAPYYQYELDLNQPIGEHFGVGGGIHLRHLEDPGDAGLFNHSFRNYYVSLDAVDLWQGSRASLRGDAWDADGEDIYSVGFELEQRLREFLRARFGTSYSLYRFDPFTGSERNRDRTYYAKFRWRLTSSLDLDTDYQYERDSVTEYHRLNVNLRTVF